MDFLVNTIIFIATLYSVFAVLYIASGFFDKKKK